MNILRLLATKNYSSSDLAVDIWHTTLIKTQSLNLSERKQVLHHLALPSANIATLKRAIELTQQESDVALYNTDNFVYRSKYKLFKGKIRKYIVQMMRKPPKPLQLPNSRNAFFRY